MGRQEADERCCDEASRHGATPGRGDLCRCARQCPSKNRLAPLVALGEEIRFRRRDVLWSIGQPADHLFIPCAGSLKLVVPRGERDAILDIVVRGEACGEEAVVPGRKRAVGCVALADGRGVRVDAALLRPALRDHPDALLALVGTATARAHHYARNVAHAQAGTVPERTARVLLDLADKYGLPDARGTLIPLRLGRVDIADMVGCRVETAIRCMSAWEREGILCAQREGILLYARESLQSLCA